jgi:hypothetical protein
MTMANSFKLTFNKYLFIKCLLNIYMGNIISKKSIFSKPCDNHKTNHINVLPPYFEASENKSENTRINIITNKEL